jgi:hypothetical protein
LVVKLGMVMSANNVQLITILIKMEFVVKLNLNAKLSTKMLEFVNNVMKDMEFKMVNALQIT